MVKYLLGRLKRKFSFGANKIKIGMLKKLDHKNNNLRLELQGNFSDSKDSFFSISKAESWHVTFVKVDDHVEEWIRKIVVLEGTDEIFISDVEFKYISHYKALGSARAFVKRQADYLKYKEFICVYLNQPVQMSDYFYPNRGYGDMDAPF
jgi:hypothetical protein